MSSLPQHSLLAFRRYEDVIALAVNEFPCTIQLDKTDRKNYNLPYSIHTCAARCRDAINALILHINDKDWTSGKVNCLKLLSIRSDFGVAIQDQVLLIGKKSELRAQQKVKREVAHAIEGHTKDVEIERADSSLVADGLGLQLDTLFKLAQRGELKHSYSLGRLDEEFVKKYESLYEGIAIVYDEEKQSHILII